VPNRECYVCWEEDGDSQDVEKTSLLEEIYNLQEDIDEMREADHSTRNHRKEGVSLQGVSLCCVILLILWLIYSL
jgi:hypothetical protein